MASVCGAGTEREHRMTFAKAMPLCLVAMILPQMRRNFVSDYISVLLSL
jgi:hypothetical protein